MIAKLLGPIIDLNVSLHQYKINTKYIAIKLCPSCQAELCSELEPASTTLTKILGFIVHTDTECISCGT